MTQTYTMEDLDRRLDLIPAFAGKSDIPVAYISEADERYNGTYETYVKVLKRSGIQFKVFKLCQLTTKRNGVATYADLEDFRATDSGWESSLHDVAKADKRETYQAFRDKNLPFLRMYMMGGAEIKIVCPLTDQQVDAWEMIAGILINIWEQHHFKVRNRASVQKEEADPGEILRRMDFSDPSGQTVEGIKDMMRTIFLSPTAHKAVHNTWNDSDITNYSESQRPWALRNQANWDLWLDWLEAYGYARSLFGTYEDWILSLTH